MSDTSRFPEYSASMAKCRKTYTIVPFVYIGMCLFYMMFSFTYLCLDGSIISPIVCIFGFIGAYKKHDLSVLAAPALLLLNLVFKAISPNSPKISFYFCLLLFISSCVLAYINMKTNIKYHYLEKQVGFPFFNERVEEQRVNKIRREIKDPFQDEYDRRMRTSSSEMGSIELKETDQDTD